MPESLHQKFQKSARNWCLNECFPPAHWIKQCWCWCYIETRFLCFTRL